MRPPRFSLEWCPWWTAARWQGPAGSTYTQECTCQCSLQNKSHWNLSRHLLTSTQVQCVGLDGSWWRMYRLQELATCFLFFFKISDQFLLVSCNITHYYVSVSSFISSQVSSSRLLPVLVFVIPPMVIHTFIQQHNSVNVGDCSGWSFGFTEILALSGMKSQTLTLKDVVVVHA